MNKENCLAVLSISEAAAVLSPHWEESVSLYQAPSFLADAERIRSIAEYCGIHAAAITTCINCAQKIGASQEASFLFFHLYRLAFEKLDYPSKNFSSLPLLPLLGEHESVVYLLLTLQVSEEIRAFHKNKHIPEQISQETLYDVAINMDKWERTHGGLIGLAPALLGWFRTHNSRALYRIGRLQFHYKACDDTIAVYRNKQTQDIVTFSKAGVHYTSEGFCAVDGQEDQLSDNWYSVWEETEKGLTANPITAGGQAQQKTITIQPDEWDCELGLGKHTLDVHIPEGGGMTVEACIASMTNALPFFQTYFPEKTVDGFSCRSWIYSPQYDELYRPDANFVLFQKEVHLFPVWSSGTEGIYFVFDTDDIDLETVECRSSLQKAMVGHLRAGGVLRAGGMFFLKKDMAQLGQRCYHQEASQ